MSQYTDVTSTKKVVENGNTPSKGERVKIRCEECNLPFWSPEQLEKHSVTHQRRKNFKCTHCKKGFTRADHLKMHERSCDNNPSTKKVERKSFLTLQVGRGAKESFQFIESALGGVMQVWRYDFSESENKDVYESLNSVLLNDARDLVLEASGLFKCYLALKVIFHKAANPDELTDPPAFFQTDPFASYNKYDDDVWEIVKEQLEQQIDNFEQNGSRVSIRPSAYGGGRVPPTGGGDF
jgi:transposase-like protein